MHGFYREQQKRTAEVERRLTESSAVEATALKTAADIEQRQSALAAASASYHRQEAALSQAAEATQIRQVRSVSIYNP